MARSITRRTLVGFRPTRVNAQYYKDRIDVIKNNPATFVNEVRDGRRFWKANDKDHMTFNAIVGNPPYQVMDGGGAGTSAITIYHHFINISKAIHPKYISLIVPARWYAGGKGLDEFRNNMLSDKRIEKIIDYPNPKDCFPTANISGGVCCFLWNRQYSNKCHFTNIVNHEIFAEERELNEFEVFVRYNKALSIIRKIVDVTSNYISNIVAARNLYNLDSSVRGFSGKEQETDIKVYTSRGVGYIQLESITSGLSSIDSYKLFMGKVLSGHIGETDEKGQVKVIASIFIGSAYEVCTDSYLVIGPFRIKKEAVNAERYFKTKFLRFLLLQSLVSMNISRNNFRFVPLQDFTSKSDIDWSRSIGEIDAQLYEKYGLERNEIDFSERMIKPME